MEVLKAEKLGIITKNEIIKLHSLYDYNGNNVWEYFGKILDRQLGIETDFEILERYYEKAFSYYADNNVSHIEMKIVPLGSEEMAVQKAKVIKFAYHKIRNIHNDFTVRILVCGLKLKVLNMELNDIIMNNAKVIYNTVKDDYDKDNIEDFMVGIDFVNEEDKSRNLSEFENYIIDAKKSMPEIVFTPHAGESLILDDSNIKYASSMGAYRIGHGFNLYKNEKLEREIIDKNITLEICPLSNQVLGYVKDLRKHPAKIYIEDGVSIVIASDDPGFFERKSLIDDYFAVILEFDLSYEMTRNIVLNSIKKSLLTKNEKERIIRKITKEFEQSCNE